MFATTAGACFRMAAPVLEFGVDPASPRANTFGYRTCCMVCLSTSTYPVGSPVDSGLALIQSGADWRGTACSMSKGSVLSVPPSPTALTVTLRDSVSTAVISDSVCRWMP